MVTAIHGITRVRLSAGCCDVIPQPATHDALNHSRPRPRSSVRAGVTWHFQCYIRASTGAGTPAEAIALHWNEQDHTQHLSGHPALPWASWVSVSQTVVWPDVCLAPRAWKKRGSGKACVVTLATLKSLVTKLTSRLWSELIFYFLLRDSDIILPHIHRQRNIKSNSYITHSPPPPPQKTERGKK